MGKIWEFYENLDEYVYVSDMDNYELIYMNKKARANFGIQSMEELLGKKCHKVLQNCSMPCSICTNPELVPGFFKRWSYYNPVLKEHIILFDTMLKDNGRRCRMEIAVSIGAQEMRNVPASHHENPETLVNMAIETAMRKGSPDDSLQCMLEYLGQILEGERAYIFEKQDNNHDDNTYEWVANGVTPEKDNLQNLPPEVCAAWYHQFKMKRHIIIQNLEDIQEEDPILYSVLEPQGIHSLVVVPLYDATEVIGFFGVDNPPLELLDYVSGILHMVGHFMVATLKQRNLVRKLEEMSKLDQLTRLGNRHAMDQYIMNIAPQKAVGIVYCDITGLKKINDTQGHHAGDRLILRASHCLQEILEGYGLFRIGGDELLAICPEISESTLDEKAKLLKEIALENNVVLAIGTSWVSCGEKEMMKLIADAETRMYTDKALYYKTTGIDRRR